MKFCYSILVALGLFKQPSFPQTSLPLGVNAGAGWMVVQCFLAIGFAWLSGRRKKFIFQL